MDEQAIAQTKPVAGEFDSFAQEKLGQWVRVHGVRAGAVRAKAYLLVKESRANLLVKGTIVLDERGQHVATEK